MGLKSPRGNLGQLSGLAFVRRLPKVLLRKVGEKVLRNKRLSPPVSQTPTAALDIIFERKSGKKYHK